MNKLSVTGNLIRLRGAVYWTNGAWAPITGTVGATLTASILRADAAETPVPNAQNVPMSLDSGTQSDWSCVMPANVTLNDREIYWVLLTITVGGIPVPIRQRIPASFPDGSTLA